MFIHNIYIYIYPIIYLYMYIYYIYLFFLDPPPGLWSQGTDRSGHRSRALSIFFRTSRWSSCHLSSFRRSRFAIRSTWRLEERCTSLFWNQQLGEIFSIDQSQTKQLSGNWNLGLFFNKSTFATYGFEGLTDTLFSKNHESNKNISHWRLRSFISWSESS